MALILLPLLLWLVAGQRDALNADGTQANLLEWMDRDPALIDPPLRLSIAPILGGREIAAPGGTVRLPDSIVGHERKHISPDRSHYRFEAVGDGVGGGVIIARSPGSRFSAQLGTRFDDAPGGHEAFLKSFASDLQLYDWAFGFTPDDVRRAEGDRKRVAFQALTLRRLEGAPQRRIAGPHFTGYVATRYYAEGERPTAQVRVTLFDADGSEWGWALVAIYDPKPGDLLGLTIAEHIIASLQPEDARPTTAPATRPSG